MSAVEPRNNAYFGWIADRPDQRDVMMSVANNEVIRNLSPRVDLRSKNPIIYDQGELGSCTANAINGMYIYESQKEHGTVPSLSRLFLYYNERAMEGSIDSDSGAMIRDGLKCIATQGVCEESFQPYVIEDFAKKPSDAAYANALNHQALRYLRLPQSVLAMKVCLAQGFNFVFGFTVYESFMSKNVARDGFVSLPQFNESSMGGHAVRAVGYDDAINGGSIIVANSWSVQWGDAGYFYLPYSYVTNKSLAQDFWTIRSNEG